MSTEGPLFLIGMMGAGKSTIGERLAKALGLAFIDTDAEIEKRAGRSIAQIFEEEGEAAFRKRERAALRELAGQNAVISLGGGAIVQPGTFDSLHSLGRMIYLEASVEALLDRIPNPESRPLLAGLNERERHQRLENLLAERRGCYERAHLRIDGEAPPETVVERVVAALQADPPAQRRETGSDTANAVLARKDMNANKRKRSRAKGRAIVPVELGTGTTDRSYAVEIGHDWLEEIGRQAARKLAASRVALITVPSVARRYGPALTRGLKAEGVKVGRIVVPDGDGTKNLKQLGTLYEAFLDQGLDRHSGVVTLGGGVTGDLGGFAAATFLRGIPFVQVPTTVLAMVDASIGGKTGVNLKRGKNLVGAFHQPRGVFLDTMTLKSLPKRQRAAGAAEIIKAAAIWDLRFFEELEGSIEAFLDLDPKVVVPVLERACEIKAEVVEADEREGGLRRLLNFGHTLAHAVEAHAKYKGVLHGEAVAMGMVFAADRSESLGFAPAGTTERLEALINRAGLPTQLPKRPRQAYLSAIGVDKKKQGDTIHFVVSKGIGEAGTAALKPRDILPPGWKA